MWLITFLIAKCIANWSRDAEKEDSELTLWLYSTVLEGGKAGKRNRKKIDEKKGPKEVSVPVCTSHSFTWVQDEVLSGKCD